MHATLQGRVQQVIDGLVESGDEIGLQVAAYVNGELVVDTWSGVADEWPEPTEETAYLVAETIRAYLDETTA